MIEVQVVCSCPIAEVESLVTRAAEAALRLADVDPKLAAMSVVLADDEELARLNREFRGIDGPTDVLSFDFDGDDPSGEMSGYLGDVVVSVERARVQAEEAGHSLERELAVLVAHGALHLAGYDHAEESDEQSMFARQEAAATEALGA